MSEWLDADSSCQWARRKELVSPTALKIQVRITLITNYMLHVARKDKEA